MAATPEHLGKYKIVRVVGKGAMGVVYEGFDTVIERTVAIKTIRTDELDPAEAEEHSRRFLIEAKAAGKLNHPNIVGIYDYGNEQNLAYIVMEYVQGKELKAYFDAGHHFNTEQILRIMGQLLGALELAHANGVVHRDIKPANIFLTDNGTVKLGDFGIARIDSTHKTHAGTILGTPSYMSPEQIKGESVDQRSDLYSTGVILYQFLTGEKPFSGSMVAVMHKVLNEEPPPPSSLNPQISPAFDLVVARAMAKDLSARFPDARQFAIALRGAAKRPEDEESEATRVINLKDLDLIQGQTTPADATSRTGASLRGSSTVQRESTLADSEIEIEFWRSIKDSEETANFDVYLRKYPQGHYAELAQLKLDKLRRTESTLTAKAEATSTHTGTTDIGEMRRKAEEARRRAEEEYRRAEEELKRAEEAQHKAQEEATGKAEAAVAEALDVQRIADELSKNAVGAIGSGAVAEAVKSIKPRAESAFQAAGQIQSRLRDLLAARQLLQAETLGKAESALSLTETIQQTLRETLSRLESAMGQLLEASQRKAEVAIDAVHAATLALQQAEQLSQQAIQAGTIVTSADKISQLINKTSSLAAEAKSKVQAALLEKHLLVDEVLEKLQSGAAANEQIFQKVEQVNQNFDEARSKAEEEARRKAEEEARRKAEEAAKRKANEENKRKGEEEARRKAEENAKREAEALAEAKRQAEEEAKRKAEEEARRKAEEEARRKAEENAKREAEAAVAEAKRQAEVEAKRKAEEDARRKAEENAKREAEALAEAKRQAEVEARRKGEVEAKSKADEEARRKAEENAKREAEAAAEAKRLAEQAEAEATLMATATRLEESEATQYIQPARPVREPVPVPPTAAQAVSKPQNAIFVPAIVGGVVVLAIVGWLVLKPDGQHPAPTQPPSPALTSPAPSGQPERESATASQQQADQAKATSKEAEMARRQADLLAKSKAEQAAKALEEAKKLTDTNAREAAMKAAKEEARLAEEARQAAAAAKAKAKDAAEAEATARAKAEADATAKAKAKAKAEADAADKAKAEAEAAAKAKVVADAAAKAKAKAEADAADKAKAEADAAAKAKAKAEAAPAAKAPVNPVALYQQAQALEQTSVREAVKRYEEAGNAGYGPASKRLGEIYVNGTGNVGRDYVKSVKWYAKARDQGMDVDNTGK